MKLTIAWLAGGKIRLKAGDEPPRTVESRLGEAIRDRAVQSQQRHGWKNQGAGEKFLAGAMLWGRVSRDPAVIPIHITSLCRGAGAGQVLYSLEEGDSFDAAPRWVPGDGRRLVFQSAGVGRGGDGQFAGLGWFGIQLLDVDRGELQTLLEEPGHDLLTPQLRADGTLYFIRRPYDTGHRVHAWRPLKDIVMFPFRLGYAVFVVLPDGTVERVAVEAMIEQVAVV